NRYLDRIRYGNLKPYLPTLATTGTAWPDPNDLSGQQWLFEVIFDYGNHSGPNPTATASPVRAVRADPFSAHRAGFQIRTYRLCRRGLIFHHFDQELAAADYLVCSTDFDYAEPTSPDDPTQAGYTVLQSVTQRAYQKRSPADATYESRQLPPLVFIYSVAKVNPTVRNIAAGELDNLPIGVQGAGYQWVDLD